MSLLRSLTVTVLLLCSTTVSADAPAVESALPLLNIEERGELLFKNDDFSFAPWRSDRNPGKVHVVQYFGGTMAASETFKPLTDSLQESLTPGTYHVTTIINLDAAMWGTSGFVLSELKKNKRMHPMSTMVLDESGAGVQEWKLGEAGTGLAILDQEGIVKYFTREPLSDAEIKSTLDLIRANIDS